MKPARSTAIARTRLDQRLGEFGAPTRYSAPPQGWIRAIRKALGMTTAQFAKRLGMAQPTAVRLEQSEAKGTIELSTLRRAAEALDCTVIYALVPNKPLEEKVRERAEMFLRRRLGPIEHSMLLEDQKVAGSRDEARLDELLRETNPRLFWE